MVELKIYGKVLRRDSCHALSAERSVRAFTVKSVTPNMMNMETKFGSEGGYSQIAKDKNIICDCKWGSLYPSNYINGEKIYRHIEMFMKKNGRYVLIKGVPEHRIIVESYIGRKLTKEEQIHHLDENKQNNDIDNLMVFPTNSAHQKFHTKIRQFGITNNIRKQINERWDNFK